MGVYFRYIAARGDLNVMTEQDNTDYRTPVDLFDPSKQEHMAALKQYVKTQNWPVSFWEKIVTTKITHEDA